jgi:hypothetical protein
MLSPEQTARMPGPSRCRGRAEGGDAEQRERIRGAATYRAPRTSPSTVSTYRRV